MSFISSIIIKEIKPRKIKIFTGIDWDYLMIPSVTKYLFEDLNIIDNFAPKGQNNRPGKIYKKHYICVHDTGDHSFGAKQWSDIVKNAKIGKRDYRCSFQYVVGNDGYYHNIPDNEVAHHAGDGRTEESIFGLIPSGVYTDEIKSEKAKIEIDEEGYYTINGIKSLIKSPTNDKGQILQTKYINDLGIYSELKIEDNIQNKYQYYLGRTWYNPIFNRISNYGGNLNSIGIESCINVNTDIYYTFQKVAKLVAKLMEEKELILVEYQILQYKNIGYSFEFKSESEFVNDKGRVIKAVENETIVKYIIIIKDKNGNSLDKSFESCVYPPE